jgi:hypothetical protein
VNRWYHIAFALPLAAACELKDLDVSDNVPEGSACTADSVHVTAWAAARPEDDGSVEVSGTARARDGVTVRAIYVAGTRVQTTEYNFRAWTVVVPASRVRAIARSGVARLPLVLYSSDGCLELPDAVIVGLPDGGHPRDGGDEDGGSDVGDAAPRDSGKDADMQDARGDSGLRDAIADVTPVPEDAAVTD